MKDQDFRFGDAAVCCRLENTVNYLRLGDYESHFGGPNMVLHLKFRVTWIRTSKHTASCNNPQDNNWVVDVIERG